MLQEVTSASKSDSSESVFYSKSQWGRWLNGDAQPPRKAVRRLAEHLEKEGLAADSVVDLWDQAFAPQRGAVRPRQIPASAQQFIGRARELEALAALAEPAISGRGPSVIAIEGPAGVGKTTLANHFALRVRDQFPDGQLYVNIRGFDPSGQPMTPDGALRDFLDALGIPSRGTKAELGRLAAQYRSVLAGKRVVVVIDNAYEAEQVRDLLPGSPGTLVLITSRNQLCALAAVGARLVQVEPFSLNEARKLLADRLGAERVQGEQEAAAELIGLCANLPLALVVAAAHAETHPDFPLGALIKEFRDLGLDLLETGDRATSARAVFATSYQHLSKTDARVFRLLGLHPGLDISLEAAASLTAMPVDQVRRALSSLVRSHLIEVPKPGRFVCHDLLRAYAAELASEHDTDEERHAAIGRLLGHYLRSALAAAELLQPRRWGVRPPAALPGTVPVDVIDREQATAWFEAECLALLALAGVAETNGFDEYAWLIPWATTAFLSRSGRHQDWVQSQRAAVAAAGRLGDSNAQAHSQYLLGFALSMTGDNAAAEPHVRRALDLFRELGDGGHQAMALNGLAAMMNQAGRHKEALDIALDGLRTVKAAGSWWVQGTLENEVGHLYGRLGEFEQGLEHCQRAIRLHRKAGNFAAAGSGIHTTGDIYRQRGDLAQARTAYQQAIEVFRDENAPFDEAQALNALGDTLSALEDEPEAIRAWQTAQTILDRLAHPLADEVRAKLSGCAGSEGRRRES